MRTQTAILSVILAIWMGFLTPSVECANILALVPFCGKSHFIVIEPLLKGLANKGHNVTVVSGFPLKKRIANYKDMDVSHVIPGVAGTYTFEFVREHYSSTGKSLHALRMLGDNLCEKMYKDQVFKKLLVSTDKYDLVMTEIFVTECFLPFAHKFDAPAVSITTSVALPWTNDRIANPANPSYVPSYFMSYSDQMSFYERLKNTVLLWYAKLFSYYYMDRLHYDMVRKYFGEDLPPLEEIARQRTSLVLVNSYLAVNQPRPLVPNFIEIGGIHLQEPQPLPDELKLMLDKATHGIIFFSLGSLIRSSSMDQKKLDAVVQAFSKLPQLVLWKFDEEIPKLPPNVITNKWWPQRDILGHKNIKVFITHGGLSSVLEGVNTGVPMLGIPLFADQYGNINNIVRRGAGIQLNYDDITFETLYDSLSTLTNDKSYMRNAKELSRQFKDRPLSPLDNAIFWIEYVLRHKGAYHLRSAAVDLPLYQYLLLDVITFLFLSSFAVLFIIYKITRRFYSLVFIKNKISVKYNKSKKRQ